MTTLYDTGIYTLPSDVNMDKLFGDRGKSFLKSEPNARLYDMFDGNFNLKSRQPIQPSKCYEVPVIKYQNNAVYSDFPRGPGMLDTTFMWADATYDQMRRAVERQNAEVPHFIESAPPLRQEIFDLGAMTGGKQKLVLDSIERYKSMVQLEKDEKLINYLRSLGVNEAEIDEILKLQQAEEMTNALSTSAAGVTNTEAKKLLTQAVMRNKNREAMAKPGVSIDDDEVESLYPRIDIGRTVSTFSESTGRRRRTLAPSGSLNTAQQVALPTNVPHRMPPVAGAGSSFLSGLRNMTAGESGYLRAMYTDIPPGYRASSASDIVQRERFSRM
jgi:DNA-binding transcriptional MerR regulator